MLDWDVPTQGAVDCPAREGSWTALALLGTANWLLRVSMYKKGIMQTIMQTIELHWGLKVLNFHIIKTGMPPDRQVHALHAGGAWSGPQCGG